jgi:hypothetical protein
MLTAATPNDSELADIEYRAAELAARFPEAEGCATCGKELPLVYRVRPGEAYCECCSRYPRLYASTVEIVNRALKSRHGFRNPVHLTTLLDVARSHSGSLEHLSPQAAVDSLPTVVVVDGEHTLRASIEGFS